MKEKRSSFSGSIGFVLAAAGSAVGVGNIWRFPYLCAKDGGGLFLLVYLVLVLTFGFVLLTTDVAIGRKTKKNALKAFEELNPKWKFLGRLTFLVPVLIMTYYSVIGGWITKYLFVYLVSDGIEAAADGYFTSFITSDIAPIVFMLIFLALTAWIVFRGVEKGIEKFSKIIMPGLILLIVIIAVFCLTLTNTAPDGTVRTGMQGLAVYLKPDFHGLTVKRFLEILLDAMSQLLNFITFYTQKKATWQTMPIINFNVIMPSRTSGSLCIYHNTPIHLLPVSYHFQEAHLLCCVPSVKSLSNSLSDLLVSTLSTLDETPHPY